MASEKFLNKFFSKLTRDDFKKDPFLLAFDKFFRKSKSTDICQFYMDYILRNQEFADENERNSAIKDAYDQIYNDILFKGENAVTRVGFMSEEYKKGYSPGDIKSHVNLSQDSVAGTDTSTNPDTYTSQNTDADQSSNATDDTSTAKGKVKVNKAKALRILSMYIKQSNILTYDDPNEISNERDEKFRDETHANIISEITNDDGRVMPKPKPNVEFGQRSSMMDIWRDTESKCNKLCEVPKLDYIISKVFFIDTKVFDPDISSGSNKRTKRDKITSVDMEEVKDLIPMETFIGVYSNVTYPETTVKLINIHPLQAAVDIHKQKPKALYICAGSQMVQGGNADQGINTQESMLYMTSTYSVGIGKGLHAYPLTIDQVFICPNVLVFKDTNYQELPMNEYKRIAVMCCPNKWRAKLVNPKYQNLSNESTTEYLYDTKTTFEQPSMYKKLQNAFMNALETALFFGYDSIIVDDRAIEDNLAPAHPMAQIMKESFRYFVGRFKDIIIAVDRAESFNVFRHYFST